MRKRLATIPTVPMGQSGFTLIEVLVGMALFMVAVTGSLAMYSRSVENNQLSMISTMVTNLAYEQMDSLLAMPYNDARLVPGAQAPVGFTFPDYHVQGEMFWTVHPESSAIRNSKLITLHIFWRRGDPSNPEHPHGPFTLSFLKPEML